jgi:hypothetical protein
LEFDPHPGHNSNGKVRVVFNSIPEEFKPDVVITEVDRRK